MNLVKEVYIKNKKVLIPVGNKTEEVQLNYSPNIISSQTKDENSGKMTEILKQIWEIVISSASNEQKFYSELSKSARENKIELKPHSVGEDGRSIVNAAKTYIQAFSNQQTSLDTLGYEYIKEEQWTKVLQLISSKDFILQVYSGVGGEIEDILSLAIKRRSGSYNGKEKSLRELINLLNLNSFEDEKKQEELAKSLAISFEKTFPNQETDFLELAKLCIKEYKSSSSRKVEAFLRTFLEKNSIILSTSYQEEEKINDGNIFYNLIIKTLEENQVNTFREVSSKSSTRLADLGEISKDIFIQIAEKILSTIAEICEKIYPLFSLKKFLSGSSYSNVLGEILKKNYEEYITKERKSETDLSIARYVNSIFNNKLKGYKASTQGTLGEIISTLLLKEGVSSVGGKATLMGQSLNQLSQQAHIDILVELNNLKIGIQVKQYNASPITATFYKNPYNLFGGSLARYFSTTDGSEMGTKIVSELRYYSLLESPTATESMIKGFLGQYISSLTRFTDPLADPSLAGVQNNFFIYNFHLIPASVIFSSLIVELNTFYKRLKDYFDLDNFYLKKLNNEELFFKLRKETDSRREELSKNLLNDNFLFVNDSAKEKLKRSFEFKGVTVSLDKLIKKG